MLRCRWLRSGSRQQAYYCWQKGKRVRGSECRCCLSAQILSSLTTFESIKYPRFRKEVKP